MMYAGAGLPEVTGSQSHNLSLCCCLLRLQRHVFPTDRPAHSLVRSKMPKFATDCHGVLLPGDDVTV
eukprot:1500170-Rhodomonas_salina.1